MATSITLQDFINKAKIKFGNYGYIYSLMLKTGLKPTEHFECIMKLSTMYLWALDKAKDPIKFNNIQTNDIVLSLSKLLDIRDYKVVVDFDNYYSNNNNIQYVYIPIYISLPTNNTMNQKTIFRFYTDVNDRIIDSNITYEDYVNDGVNMVDIKFTHNKGYYPDVYIYDLNGQVLLVPILHIDQNTTLITLNYPPHTTGQIVFE